MVWRKFEGAVVRHSGVQPAMGCAAAPAILGQTTVLRPVSQPRLLATEIGDEPDLRCKLWPRPSPAVLIFRIVLFTTAAPQPKVNG